jgi:hypothetical protein
MRRILSLTGILLLAASAAAAGAEPPLAVPVEGSPPQGQLAAVDAKWQVSFRSGDKLQTLPAAELVRWGTCVEPQRGPLVLLADGGLLAVSDPLQADKERLTAESDLLGVLRLPLEAVAAVVFRLPAGRRERDLLFDGLARTAGESDRLVLDNGDELSGLLEAIDEKAVKLRAQVGPVELKPERVAAVVLNPALRQRSKPQGLHAWVGLADGSRLLVGQLLLAPTTLSVTTVGGQTWKGKPGGLVFLQPLGGRATYLSDLTPEGYRHVPFLDLAWPYHADRSVTGGGLRCGGRLYLKGLGVHSAARLSYRLDQPYRRFEAELGIDDETAGAGSVRFRIFLDGRERFTSPIVRGGDAPVPVVLDLGGTKRLDLVVDYADQGDVMDHADWLDARLLR